MRQSITRPDTLCIKTKRQERDKGRRRKELKHDLSEVKVSTVHSPLVILANVRSLCNKTDELKANVFHLYEYLTASILALIKTLLNGNDSRNSLHIDRFRSPVRLDRDTHLTGV